jgi:hypothetical protein
MRIQIERDFEARLNTGAAARGLTVAPYIEHLVRTDQSAVPTLDEKLAALVESLRLDHGDAPGRSYFSHLRLDATPEVEELICRRGVAEQISPEEYLRRRVEAES